MTDKQKAAATPKPSGRFTESPMPLPAVGMGDDEIDKVAPAFENDNWDKVASFLDQ